MQNITENELKGYLGTGLRVRTKQKLQYPTANKDFRRVDITLSSKNILKVIDGHYNLALPLLHPISRLTTEIPHNGGMIVPIVELAKIALFDIYKYTFPVELKNLVRSESNDSFGLVFADEENRRYGFSYASPTEFSNQCEFRLTVDGSEMILNQLALFQKMHELHIDLYGLCERGLALEIEI